MGGFGFANHWIKLSPGEHFITYWKALPGPVILPLAIRKKANLHDSIQSDQDSIYACSWCKD
jgi:hypothetical protein